MLLDECVQKFHTLREEKSRIFGQVSKAEIFNVDCDKSKNSELTKKEVEREVPRG